MTLSLVGYVSGVASNPSPFNIALPGGSVAGDLIVGAAIGGVGDTSTPSGFTLLDGPTASDSAEVRSFSKTLVAGDITNGYVTMPGSPSFNATQHSLWVWHSTSGTPTVDGHSTRQAADGTSPTVYNSGTITTAGTGRAVCVAMGGRGGSGQTAWSSTPGSVTIDQNAPTNYIHTLSYHYTFAGSGATTDQTASLNSAFDREHAAVIGVADSANTQAVAGIASGTGTANNPTVTSSSAVPAGHASGGGVARLASSSTETFHIILEDGSALVNEDYSNTAVAGTGAAYNATVSFAPNTLAPAGNAAGFGTAYNPTPKVAPIPTVAAGTGTANNPVAKSSATPTVAAGTGAAFNATPRTKPVAGAASGTGSAFNGSANLSAALRLEDGSSIFLEDGGRVLLEGTPATQISAPAGVASGSGTAYQATAGRTFYVSNTGSDAANGLTTGTAWQTVAKVNSSTGIGDTVLFQRGGIWREQLTVAGSGMVLADYGAGALPRITSGDTLGTTGWTKTGGLTNVYQKALTTDPSFFVIEDGVPMVKKTSTALCDASAGSWYWAANVVYVNATGGAKNPATNGKVVETPIRATTLNLSGGTTDVVVRNIRADLSTSFICNANTANRARFDGVDFRYCKQQAIWVWEGSPKTSDLVVIASNFEGCGETQGTPAIQVHGDNVQIRTTTFTRCMQAIQLFDQNNEHCQNFVIADNVFTDCGKDVNAVECPSGGNAGILLDGDTFGDNADYHKGQILRNTFTNLIGRAIDGFYGQSTIAYNVINNVRNHSVSGGGLGIEVNGPDNEVAHNVVYDAQGQGIMVNNDPIAPNVGSRVRNNLVVGHSGLGPDDLIFYVSGRGVTDIIDYNGYYHTGTGQFYNGGVQRTFAQWQSDGFDVHSFNANPTFVDATTGNFHLLVGSPAINTGTAIAGLNDSYFGAAPDVGAFEYAAINAGLASGSGSAFGATVTTLAVAAQPALGTGTAGAATTKESPHAGIASGTGTASNATTKATTQAGLASGTGSAFGATAKDSAPAGVAAGSGTAPTPAARFGVPAASVTGAGIAFDAVAVKTGIAAAGLAAGTGLAQTPTTVELVPAGVGSGVGSAYQPTVTAPGNTTALAELVTGSGAAYDATVVISGVQVTANAGHASGTGTATNPTTKVVATAGNAAGTGSTAASSAANIPVPIAAGAGTAFDATTIKAIIATAENVVGAGTAYNATVTVSVSVGVATGTGTAYGASVATPGNAGLASGTGAAFQATVALVVHAGLAAGVGTAPDAGTPPQFAYFITAKTPRVTWSAEPPASAFVAEPPVPTFTAETVEA